MITGLDHVQLAMPPGGEERARAFYAGVLGMREIPKPEPFAARGGCWFVSGRVHLHIGVEEPFAAARKAHPAFLVDDLAAIAVALERAGAPVGPDGSTGTSRLYTEDPFGNRIELIADGDGFSQRG